ncbi:hypothetical protein GJ496_003311 [Pomphorhynchus laevis]|nr:hypothetical protein GJ496_003311 [Pomphorhynchus laevis]
MYSINNSNISTASFPTDGDCDNELIVSYADRRVCVFRYVEHESESDKVNKSGKFVTIAHWTLDSQASNRR